MKNDEIKSTRCYRWIAGEFKQSLKRTCTIHTQNEENHKIIMHKILSRVATT